MLLRKHLKDDSGEFVDFSLEWPGVSDEYKTEHGNTLKNTLKLGDLGIDETSTNPDGKFGPVVVVMAELTRLRRVLYLRYINCRRREIVH